MDLADITGPTSVDKDDLAYILRTFIESPPQDNIRYAWGKKLANEELLESFVVEGLGKVSIPISEQVREATSHLLNKNIFVTERALMLL